MRSFLGLAKTPAGAPPEDLVISTVLPEPSHRMAEITTTEPEASSSTDFDFSEILDVTRAMLAKERKRVVPSPDPGLLPTTGWVEIVPQEHLPSVAPVAATKISKQRLVSSFTRERFARINRDGPTLEDIIREEIRAVLKTWMDVHLLGIVETQVAREIEIIRKNAG